VSKNVAFILLLRQLKLAISLIITLLLPVNAAQKTVYLPNGSFEDGFGGWREWHGQNSAGAPEVVSGMAVSGQNSLKIYNNSTVWQDIAQNQVMAGERVFVSVSLYLETGTDYDTKPALSLVITNSADLDIEILRAEPDDGYPKGEWFTIYGEAVNNGGIIPEDFRYVRLVLENHTNGAVFFDALKVSVEIDPDEIIETDEGTPVNWRPGMPVNNGDQTSGEAEITPAFPKIQIKKPEFSGTNKTFSDITGHWAEKEISSLASSGVILGVSPDEFEPEREITKKEFDLLLCRITDKEAAEFFTPSDSGEIITRVETAEILIEILLNSETPGKLEYVEMQDATEAENFYDSPNIPEKSLRSVATGVHYGILRGKSGNMFDPKGGLTRAEVAVILTRFLNLF
jgi:hypothetical protein